MSCKPCPAATAPDELGETCLVEISVRRKGRIPCFSDTACSCSGLPSRPLCARSRKSHLSGGAQGFHQLKLLYVPVRNHLMTIKSRYGKLRVTQACPENRYNPLPRQSRCARCPRGAMPLGFTSYGCDGGVESMSVKGPGLGDPWR